MNKALLATLLALLFIGAYSQSNQGVFAFSWYEGHCMSIANTGGCNPAKVALWDHQSFTIHGLWVSSKASTTYGDFDLTIIQADPALLDDMNNFWPPQSRSTGSETFLWEHEWTDHGHDYAELIYRVQPNRFEGLEGDDLNRALQSAFYHDVVAFYKSYPGAQKYPSKGLTKDSFARVFGINSDQVTLSCPKGFLVRQLKICFDITATGHTMKTCTNQANTGCKKGSNFQLPAWAISNQKRVIASASAEEL